MRRNPRNSPLRRLNPLQELINERQRADEIAQSRNRVQQLKSDLPLFIQDCVGEHMEKLETKLLSDFKELGQRAIEVSAAVLNKQLSERIQTLEKVSALQFGTIVKLRDSSKAADQKVGAVVNVIEKSLGGVVPGFKLEPPAYPPLPSVPPSRHSQFQLSEPRTEVVKAWTQEPGELSARLGFCPNCTSTNVRRANRSGIFENFLRLFFIAPFRCRACRHKFYQF
jgi:hypothetical protein